MNFGSWAAYDHVEENQVKRIQKARKGENTPIEIDRGNGTASFLGSGKNPYIVTLDSCSCFDFSKRKLPCKHIYRLAMELGLIDEQFEKGRNKEAFMEEVKSLPEGAQKLLFDLTYHWLHQSSGQYLLHRGEDSEALFLKGFCIESLNDYAQAANQMSASQIKEELCYQAIPGVPPLRSQKKTFIKWLSEMEASDLQMLRDNFTVLEFTQQTEENKHRIHRSLVNKFREPSSINTYW